MKKVFLDLSEAKGLGDTLSATPVIRKLKESYGSKIYVITNYPELFHNNRNVEKAYYVNAINIENVKSTQIYHSSFNNVGKKNEFGVEFKSNVCDIRQYHAMTLGFQLSEDDLYTQYEPDEYIPIDGLPEKFVLIHPAENWPSRTWDKDKWADLVNLLCRSNINVVITGKNTEEYGFFHITKKIFSIKQDLVLDLSNKTNISQTWHLIDKSSCFITMDSGLLHLAGTTDAEIIQLGSSINNEFRAPYRYMSQDYKYHYISGPCGIFCASDMKYGVREWGTIQGVPPLIGCLENKPEFECHPSVIDVYETIMKII